MSQAPTISDFYTYQGRDFTSADWDQNWIALILILTSGNYDVDFGVVTAVSYYGDISNCTGFPNTQLSMVAGENLTAGNALRVSSSSAYKCTSGSTAGITNFIGFAVNSVSTGETVTIETRNFTTSGLTPGSTYYLSTSGAIATTKGTYVKPVGFATSATNLFIEPNSQGADVAFTAITMNNGALSLTDGSITMSNGSLNVSGGIVNVSSGNSASTFGSTGNTGAFCIQATNSSSSGACLQLNLGGDRSADTTYRVIQYLDGPDVERFYVLGNGDVYNISGTYGTISDKDLKENIVESRNYLEDLCKLRLVNFNFKGETKKHLGLIAQEVKEIFPSLVEETIVKNPLKLKNAETEEYEPTLSIKQSVIQTMLIKSIQELNKKCSDLENRIIELESK